MKKKKKISDYFKKQKESEPEEIEEEESSSSEEEESSDDEEDVKDDDTDPVQVKRLQVSILESVGENNLKRFILDYDPSHSNEQKIKNILSNKKNRTQKIRSCINKVLKKNLKRIYQQFVSWKNSNLSKLTLVNELHSKFIGEKSTLEKRSEEDQNILSLGNIQEELSGFFELCNILIPPEILTIILDYLPRNYDTLINAGASCKFLYIRILATWKSIKINRKNVHKISLLALKSASHVEIQGITKPEQKYIFERLDPKTLRSLSLDYSRIKISSVLKLIHRIKTKYQSNSPFKNVETLTMCQFVNYRVRTVLKLTDLFPKLSKIRYLSPGGYYNELNSTDRILHLELLNLGSISTWKLDSLKKHFPLSNLQTLRFSDVSTQTNQWDNFFEQRNRQLLTLIEKCQELRVLEFNFCCGEPTVELESDRSRTKFDMSKFFQFLPGKCQNLKTLIIQQDERPDQVFIDSKETKNQTDGIVSVEYFSNPNLENLEIKGSKLRSKKFTILDFNLEDLLTQNFFHYHLNLKTFKGDLSLTSRKGKSRTEKEVRKVINKFLSCLEQRLIPNLQKFDMKIRNGDRCFHPEMLRIRFDKSFFQNVRLRVKYVEKKFVKKFKSARTKPCLILLQEFLKTKFSGIVEKEGMSVFLIEPFQYFYKNVRKKRENVEFKLSKKVDKKLIEKIRTDLLHDEFLSRLGFVLSEDNDCIELVKKNLM